MFRSATDRFRQSAIFKIVVPGSIILSLALGTAVYILDRDWSTALFLAPILDWQPDPFGLFGRLGYVLPSFFHACAFTLLLIVAFGRTRHARRVGAVTWFIIAATLEIAQAEFLRETVFGTSAHPASATLLNIIQSYVVNGHFDSGDLVATALGCAVAYLIASALEEQK